MIAYCWELRVKEIGKIKESTTSPISQGVAAVIFFCYCSSAAALRLLLDVFALNCSKESGSGNIFLFM